MSLPPPRVVLVLVVALLASGLAAVAIRGPSDESGKVASRAVTSTSSTTSSTAAATSTSAAPAPTTTVPSAEAALFAQIKDQVAQVRELPWLAPLDIQVSS
ncbi:MAG: hypothetical protein JWP02_3243, partial [Acidimicrobiales bacterium]|nr:hypothetical protein [Acidimicrobiales bacterium]